MKQVTLHYIRCIFVFEIYVTEQIWSGERKEEKFINTLTESFPTKKSDPRPYPSVYLVSVGLGPSIENRSLHILVFFNLQIKNPVTLKPNWQYVVLTDYVVNSLIPKKS